MSRASILVRQSSRGSLVATLLCILVGHLNVGCVYQKLSLRDVSTAKKNGEKSEAGAQPPEQETKGRSAGNFPASVEEERARRKRRRFWALTLSPAEIALGAGLTALAVVSIGAPVSNPSEPSEGIVGDLKDSGKSAAGTILLFAAGGAILASGLGDFALGLSDRWFGSPFIGRAADGRETLLNQAELSSVWQLDATLGAPISFRGTESQLGLGVFRWLSPHWRLRYGLSADYGARFDDAAPDYFGVSPSVQIDLNPGVRHHFGRYPRHAITAIASPRFIISATDGTPAFGWRAGLGYSAKNVSFLVGATQIPTEESLPVFEMSLIYYATTD